MSERGTVGKVDFMGLSDTERVVDAAVEEPSLAVLAFGRAG